MEREHSDDVSSGAGERQPRGNDGVRDGHPGPTDDGVTRRTEGEPPTVDITRSEPSASLRFDLTPGASLGRYVILHSLGSGGMGVIYKAYDKTLDRNVALKILRIPSDSKISAATAQARLEREAKALAQLSHPNVITVYDVGTFRGNVFVAMELVEGQTLREWLEIKKRSRQEILDVFIAAARGLAAAHEAGLIHRDFKPSNVMIGNDGRVRILDFGLARVANRDDSEPSPMSRSITGSGGPANDQPVLEMQPGTGERLRDAQLTAHGMVVGTPAYMSPEQHDNRGIEARSDQFAFCVTLYQALYGRKPFAGKTTEEIKENVLAGRVVTPPRGAQVPRWLQRIVLRGLEVDPEKRYPSMNALLVDLHRDVSRRRWRIAMAAVAVALVGAAALVPVYLDRYRSQLCQGGEEQVAAVWNDAIARTMKAGFLATSRAHAAETHERVANHLDDYGKRWVTARVDACEATHKRGEQSEKLLDLRMACLANKLHRMEALVQALTAQPDAAAVDDAMRAALSLPGLESCADVAALTRMYPLPSGADERRAIKKVEAFLDQIETQLDMGRGIQLLATAEDARQRADATAYPPVQTRAYLLLAQVQELNDRYKDAEASFQAAAQVAAKAHDDESIARAWIDLVNIVGYRQSRIEDAVSIIPFAQTAIARADDEAMLHARLARSLGWLYATSGDYREAQVYYERALEILQKRYGANSLEATSSRLALSVNYGLASVLAKQADYDQALARYERIQDIVATHFGAEHVYMVSVLGSMAQNFTNRGELEAASVHYRRALDIDRANGGTNKATMAGLLAEFAENLLRQAKLEEAQQMFERALSLRIDVLGPDHPNTAEVMGNLADALIRRGAYEEASEMLARAGRIYEASIGTRHQSYAEWLVLQAELSALRGQPSAAIEAYQQAIAIMQASTGAEHPTAAKAFTGLGELMQRRGDDAQALSYFTRALEIVEAIHGAQHASVGEARRAVAEVLIAQRRYAEALDQLERARQSLESTPGAQPMQLARTLTGLAESHLGLRNPAVALPLAQHAVEIWQQHGGKTPAPAWARFILAQCLWETGGDRARALQMAREARASLDAPTSAARLAAVGAWLARVERRAQ
ncbi:MAG TPA: serine/threonine-protein kinase [Haliangium sp.]|nr:serine/threonine-protein kinase [Haliangium sp.]